MTCQFLGYHSQDLMLSMVDTIFARNCRWAQFFFFIFYFGNPAKGAGIQVTAYIQMGRYLTQLGKEPAHAGRVVYPGFEPWTTRWELSLRTAQVKSRSLFITLGSLLITIKVEKSSYKDPPITGAIPPVLIYASPSQLKSKNLFFFHVQRIRYQIQIVQHSCGLTLAIFLPKIKV